MKPKTDLSVEEIDNQLVFSGECWNVLMPKRPVSPNHLMIVTKRADATEFTLLNKDELSELRDLAETLIEHLSKNETGDVIGYNLFSNNGDHSVGQHITLFHQHIFIRTSDESESPYSVMSAGRYWADSSSKQWVQRRDVLRELLKLVS